MKKRKDTTNEPIYLTSFFVRASEKKKNPQLPLGITRKNRRPPKKKQKTGDDFHSQHFVKKENSRSCNETGCMPRDPQWIESQRKIPFGRLHVMPSPREQSVMCIYTSADAKAQGGAAQNMGGLR